MRQLFYVFILAVTACRMEASEMESLDAFCRRYGFVQPLYEADTVTYKSRYTDMVFKHQSRMLKYNGVLVWMLAGAAKDGKTWKISGSDIRLVLSPLLRAADFTSGRKVPGLVLIDPGHGGGQTGARSVNGSFEKDLVLDIAVRIGEQLAHYGIKSAMTRDGDAELSLDSRSRMIGQLGVDLFVSIHLNSAGNKDAAGVESYLVPAAGFPSTSGGGGSGTGRVPGNSNDELNQLVAYLLQRDLVRSTGAEDRGVKRARFDVLAGATCPAVLLECGFLSNAAESRRLQTAAYRELIAIGASAGIRSYFFLWDQNRSKVKE